MSSPYRPAYGREGDMFAARFCANCSKADNRGLCPIAEAGMCLYETELGYPPEWVQDDDGSNPRCTAFLPRGEGK